MPYRPYHSQTRVENIKKKFENSEESQNGPFKYSGSTVPCKTKVLQISKDLNLQQDDRTSSQEKTDTCNESNPSNKTDGKALIKRTPAFRRDKIGCAKSLTKIPYQKSEPVQVGRKLNAQFEKNEFESKWNELQRSKTDTNLLKNCDTRLRNRDIIFNNSKLETNSQSDVDQKILEQYSVVNKDKKKTNGDDKGKVDLKLSESIRRALQSPLPKGPPPKKPPRTFCHIPQTETKSDIPKLKSKLEKLEKVIKSMEAPNNDFMADLQKKLKKTPEPTKNTDSPNKKPDNQSCLQFPNCLNKNNHTYEKLLKKTSEFYLDAEKSSKSDNKEFRPENLPVRRTSSEPIYDLPCVGKKFETFGKHNKVEGHSKTKESEGLHYMCTDVVKQVPVHPNFNFDRRKSFDGEQIGRVESKTKFFSVGRLKSTMDDDGKKNQIAELVNNLKIGAESDSGSSGVNDVNPVNCSKDCKASKEAEDLSQMTAKRKIYVSRVSSKLCSQSPYWKNINKNSQSHLFECCLLVGLTLCESKKNVPYIKSIFPPEVKPPPLIESLCFPDAAHWPPSSENQRAEEQYYSLVVTNENGERKFGYCRRVLPEGGHFCLPLTYCIISPHRASGFFYKVLEELESRHGSPEVESFIKQLYESKFPGPGERLKLKEILEEATRTSPPTEKYISSTLLRRPCDVRLEEKDLTQLFEHLQLPVFLKVFSSLLHERKVLLISNSLRKLSSCIEALQSILLPFLWQHTYIPVLPVHLIEMCEAPTPYVIGLLKSKNLEESLTSLNFEDGILVDLDDSKVIKCCGDEGSILPPRFIRDLKTSLNLAMTATDLSDSIRNVVISDAFIRFFVQVCGNYSKFIHSTSNGEKVFEKEEFIKSVTSNTFQAFLEWFTETAMFNSFIQERLHEDTEDVLVKLFRHRAMEYSEETMKTSTALLKNYKVINKKVKTLGDRIKDLTSFSK